MQSRAVEPGETVFAAGEIDRALYLLTAGRLEVGSGDSTPAMIDAPAPLNEIAFLDNGPCARTARAVTDSEVLRLSFDAFESLAAREPVLARKMLLDLGGIVAQALRLTGT